MGKIEETFDISKFDSYKEDNRREVKKAKGGLPNSLWDTYSAFANCKGGAIILGVVENEDGSWATTGLKEPRKLMKDFWDTINNKTKVSLNILSEEDVNTYEINGDTIIVIIVPPAKRELKPIFLDNDMMHKSFRRNHEGDYKCTELEVKGMLRDAPEMSADMKVLIDMSMDVFNKESVRQYRNMHKNHSENHVWENLQDEEYLERIGAARIAKEDGKMHPTTAGLLMFGEEYKILYEFPEYFLDYREEMNIGIRWTDRLQSMSGEWSGNLFDFYFRVYTKLVKDFKVPFKLEGIFRIDDTPIHKAVREALANCLVNTDFFFPRGIVIKKTDEEIIFENPGSIRTGKTQMLKGGDSDPRNKTLMKMFNMIGIGERAGSGVPSIYEIWEKEGYKSPIIEEQYGPDRTRLILPTVSLSLDESLNQASTKPQPSLNQDSSKIQLDLDELDEKILELLKTNASLSQSKIAEILNEDIGKIKTHVSRMRRNDILQHEGSNQKGIWVVKR